MRARTISTTKRNICCLIPVRQSSSTPRSTPFRASVCHSSSPACGHLARKMSACTRHCWNAGRVRAGFTHRQNIRLEQHLRIYILYPLLDSAAAGRQAKYRQESASPSYITTSGPSYDALVTGLPLRLAALASIHPLSPCHNFLLIMFFPRRLRTKRVKAALTTVEIRIHTKSKIIRPDI